MACQEDPVVFDGEGFQNGKGNEGATSSHRALEDNIPGVTSDAPLPMAKKIRMVTVASLAALGSTLFGLDIGYIGPILEDESFNIAVYGSVEKHSAEMEGVIVGLFSIGAIITAFPLISTYFLDVWGRKVSMIVGAVIFCIGTGLQGIANNVTVFGIGRLVAGLSIGMLSSVIVLYQGELAPASQRGALSTLYQLGITFGIFVAAFIDKQFLGEEGGWRWIMLAICVPAFLLLAGMVFLPRSPRWLIKQNRRAEALEVLKSLRNEEDAIREEMQIYEEVQKSKLDGTPAWSELLHGRILRLIIVGVSLQILQQLIGMNAFMYFGPKMYGALGYDKNRMTMYANLANFLSTFPAIYLADKLGRRSLMLMSSIGMTISCLVMGITGLMTAELTEEGYVINNNAASTIVICAIFFFIFNFAYGFGPIVWIYCAEIFPLRYRAQAVGLCTEANWIGNTIIAFATPTMLSNLGFSLFLVFAFVGVVAIAVSAWMPETKGVPLENIQSLFDGRWGFKGTSA